MLDNSDVSLGHMEKKFALADGVLYGPVRSRRLGNSLGINILPYNKKICSFNCGYCQCGWTTIRKWDDIAFPSVDEIGEALAAHLEACFRSGVQYDFLTLAGNGEPTLHPEFYKVVERILRERGKHMPKARVAILSNSASAGEERVRSGLNMLDERIMKLDAGSLKAIRLVNNPLADTAVDTLVDGLRSLKDVVIQSMFVNGRVDNTSDDSVREWITAVHSVAPRYVQIYTLDRIPADDGLLPVEKNRMRTIAQQLTKTTGIACEVY